MQKSVLVIVTLLIILGLGCDGSIDVGDANEDNGDESQWDPTEEDGGDLDDVPSEHSGNNGETGNTEASECAFLNAQGEQLDSDAVVDFGDVASSDEVRREFQFICRSQGYTLEGLQFSEGSKFEVDIEGGLPAVVSEEEPIQFAIDYPAGSTGDAEDSLLAIVPDLGGESYSLDVRGHRGQGCPQAVGLASTVGSSARTDSLDVSLVENPAQVELFGDESVPGDDPIVDYEWTTLAAPSEVSGPDALLESDETNPTIELSEVGVYIFQLEVVDAGGVASCIPAEVTVELYPAGDLDIQLSWDSAESQEHDIDLDLHYRPPHSSEWGDPDSVFWQFPYQSWGPSEEPSTASLAFDSISHVHGPEMVSHQNPVAGETYEVGVHYFYSSIPEGATNATLRIFVDSELIWEKTADRILVNEGDFWHAVSIEWPSAEIVEQGEFLDGDELFGTF